MKMDFVQHLSLLVANSVPLILLVENSLPSMSYKLFILLKKVVWYSLAATITNVNMDDFHFLAFPLFVDGIQCMKKIADKVGDIWNCAKCDGEFFECD